MPDNKKMIMAAIREDLPTIKKLHAKGVPLDSRMEPGGRTALHWAAAGGDLETMNYLMDNGLDPNIEGWDLSDNWRHFTPLHDTPYGTRLEAAKLLLQRGAKVDGNYVSGSKIMSPYLLAAAYQKIEMCKFLLENGADPTYKLSYGPNALTMALGNAYAPLDLIKLVVEAGADVNTVVNNKHTPLLIASTINRKDIYEYLVSVGADPHWKDEYGNTPEEYFNGKPYPRRPPIEPYEE